MGDKAREINVSAARLARAAADKYSTPDWPRFVAASMGPTGMLPSSSDPVLSQVSYGELADNFYEQAKYLVEGGVDLDALVTADLLISLFDPHTPTHDGGLIISRGRVACCGAFFPLSNNSDLAPSLGTRHRAALGLTEESDAVCLIVSEETRSVSVAQQGSLSEPMDASQLRQKLEKIFQATTKEEPKRDPWNLFSKSGNLK